MVFKYFLTVCDLAFHSLNIVFCNAKVLNFDEVQIHPFFFIDYAFDVIRSLSCKDGLNKGQKWYGPNRSQRY